MSALWQLKVVAAATEQTAWAVLTPQPCAQINQRCMKFPCCDHFATTPAFLLCPQDFWHKPSLPRNVPGYVSNHQFFFEREVPETQYQRSLRRHKPLPNLFTGLLPDSDDDNLFGLYGLNWAEMSQSVVSEPQTRRKRSMGSPSRERPARKAG